MAFCRWQSGDWFAYKHAQETGWGIGVQNPLRCAGTGLTGPNRADAVAGLVRRRRAGRGGRRAAAGPDCPYLVYTRDHGAGAAVDGPAGVQEPAALPARRVPGRPGAGPLGPPSATVDTWLTAALAARAGRPVRGLADLLDALHHLRPALLCNELHSKMRGMALEHAILVSLLEQPGSGYELARRFDRSIGRFWTATHQQIYRVLKRMEARRLDHRREIGQHGPPGQEGLLRHRPPAGRAAHRWLHEPVATRERSATTWPSRSAARPSPTRRPAALVAEVERYRADHEATARPLPGRRAPRLPGPDAPPDAAPAAPARRAARRHRVRADGARLARRRPRHPPRPRPPPPERRPRVTDPLLLNPHTYDPDALRPGDPPAAARHRRLVRGARQAARSSTTTTTATGTPTSSTSPPRSGCSRRSSPRPPTADGDPDKRWDTARNAALSEILGFYGLGYWYAWQVTILGLGPVWQSDNAAARRARRASCSTPGDVFGVRPVRAGRTAPTSTPPTWCSAPDGDGGFRATGGKYYIGNGNVAGLVSVFGRRADVEGPDGYVFFAADSRHPATTWSRTSCTSQMYVSEFRLEDYPVRARGRPAHRRGRLRRRAEHRQRRQVQPLHRLDRHLRARLLRGDHPRAQPDPLRPPGHRLPARPARASSTPTPGWSR